MDSNKKKADVVANLEVFQTLISDRTSKIESSSDYANSNSLLEFQQDLGNFSLIDFIELLCKWLYEFREEFSSSNVDLLFSFLIQRAREYKMSDDLFTMVLRTFDLLYFYDGEADK